MPTSTPQRRSQGRWRNLVENMQSRLDEQEGVIAQLSALNCEQAKEIERLKQLLEQGRETQFVLERQHGIVFVDIHGKECTKDKAFLGKGVSASTYRVKKVKLNEQGESDEKLYALKLISLMGRRKTLVATTEK